MTEDEIYRAVGLWVKAVAEKHDCKGVIAIRENETGPRPTATTSGSCCVVPEKGLYVTMDASTLDEVQNCGVSIQETENGMAEVMCTLFEVTIDLQAYRCGAFDFIRHLRSSLRLPTLARTILPGFSVRELGAVTNISEIIKGLKEERAALSITLGFTESTSCAVQTLSLECDPCFDPCAEQEPEAPLETCL